ncbi:MAG: tryptophan synthase alpha chain [Bacteroidales bacterium]|nr:tryptophan synthase alpha chain [Bacteroidales bacterium]
MKQITDAAEIDLIFFAAPISNAERMGKIAALARGFIYCVSVTGATGSRENIASGLESFLAQICSHTNLPLAMGFGISSPETAGMAAAIADGVIVSNSLIERIEENLLLVKDEPERVISYY